MDEEKPLDEQTEEAGVTAEQFGEKLRETRERAGFTIEQLASATKIMPNFLRALENGDFDQLPGEVFGRGFVKSIARCIGETDDALVQSYDLACGKKDEEAADACKAETGSTVPNRVEITNFQLLGDKRKGRSFFTPVGLLKGWTPLAALGGGAAILIGLIIAIVVISSFESSAPDPQVVVKEAPKPTELVKNTEESVPLEEDVVDQIEPQEVTTISMQNADDSAQMLEMKVKREVRIRIQVDNQGWETKKFTPEDYQFRFEKAVNLLVFDADAVDISFNGKPLGKLGQKGRVRRLSFVNSASETKKL